MRRGSTPRPTAGVGSSGPSTITPTSSSAGTSPSSATGGRPRADSPGRAAGLRRLPQGGGPRAEDPLRLGAAVHRRCVDQRGEVAGDDSRPFDVEKSTFTPIHSLRSAYYGSRHVVVQRADEVAGASARRTTPRDFRQPCPQGSQGTRAVRARYALFAQDDRALADTSEFCRSPRLAHVL